jgi:hypothetical protein
MRASVVSVEYPHDLKCATSRSMGARSADISALHFLSFLLSSPPGGFFAAWPCRRIPGSLRPRFRHRHA